MSPKASSDFGLYKEKQQDKAAPGKFVAFIVVSVVFLAGITYALIHLITTEAPSAQAEKLVLPQSMTRQPPKPFGITYRGQQPSEFTATPEKLRPQVPRQKFPNNIQEVIGYGGYTVNKSYKQSPSQYVSSNKQKNFSFADNDPFYLFKPEDPGEVNLLATGGFRFAPPSWRNVRRNPRVYNTKVQKPVSLTLNIFPDKDREIRENRGGFKQFISQRIENLQRIRVPERKPKKMVIHLNLYPEELEKQEAYSTPGIL